MKDELVPAWAAGTIAKAANEAAPTATAEARMTRWIEDMSQFAPFQWSPTGSPCATGARNGGPCQCRPGAQYNRSHGMRPVVVQPQGELVAERNHCVSRWPLMQV